jgi:hypothetical protein
VPILQRKPAPLPSPLDEFEPIYRAMGELGWSTSEVDEMEFWQVGSFMGLQDREPVIRGGRSMRRKSDDAKGKGGSSMPAPPPVSQERVEEARRRFEERRRVAT